MIILIDNGHGIETPGKRSPDGRFKEYLWNREVAEILCDILCDDGFDARLLVPETNDVSLKTRVNRANKVWEEEGDCILISIHANAAGDGSRWMQARGWSCYTTVGQTESDRLAERMYDSFRTEFPDARFRTERADGDQDYEADFYILRKTRCPAVLLENWFYDNREECAFLLRQDTKEHVAMAAFWAVRNYLEK